VIAGTCRCLLGVAGPSIMRDGVLNNPTVSIDILEPMSTINLTGRGICHNLSASEPYQLSPINLDYSTNLRYSQGYEQQIETQES